LPTITASFGERGGMLNPESNHDTEKAFYQLQQQGLLPTPTVMDTNCGDLEKIDARRAKALASKNNGNGFGPTIGELANRGLLPTPQANKVNGCDLNSENLANRNKGNLEETVAGWVVHGFLPTPATRDYKGARSTEALQESGRNETNSLPDAFHQPGKTSQLNPQFVAEMMGFPPDWLELPFQSTETKA
jgi:hypothetical protein